MTWRFVTNPERHGRQYRVLTLRDSDRLSAYLVFQRYAQELQIIDLLGDDDQAAIALIGRVVKEAEATGLAAVSTWQMPDASLHLALERYGFANDLPITYFGYRPIRAADGLGLAADYRNWYLTMSDSDNF